MKAYSTPYKNRTGSIYGLIAITFYAHIANGASLFGDHTCQNWGKLDYSEKRIWTNAFLAPLSLTLTAQNKSANDKYNDDPKAYEAAITSIDGFCIQHPDLNAPDAAVNYLKNLIQNPSN